jgi:hypothetical protein
MNILHSISPLTLDKCESEVNGSRIEDGEEEPEPQAHRSRNQELLLPFKPPHFRAHHTSHRIR